MDNFIIHVNKFLERTNEIEIFLDNISSQKKFLSELESVKEILLERDLKSILDYEEKIKLLSNSAVQYNAVIISIYGCFEFFIDSILTEYVNEIFKIGDIYESLPEKIKERHIRKIGEYLSNQNRFNGYDLNQYSVIEDVYKCLSNNAEAKLIMPLLLAHGGNMSYPQLIDLMTELGISNVKNKILQNDYFIEYFRDQGKIHEYEASLAGKDSLLFKNLSDLVQERNNVAHGWVIDNRISFIDVKDRILKFVKCLANTLCDILINESFDKLFENNKLKKFDNAIAVYNNHILCLNIKEATLYIGGYIYAKTEDGQSRCLLIENIQIDGKNCIKVEGGNIDIGLQINKRVKSTYEFYYKHNY